MSEVSTASSATTATASGSGGGTGGTRAVYPPTGALSPAPRLPRFRGVLSLMRRFAVLPALAVLLIAAAPAAAAPFSGDFDGDGRADLAVGVPGESLGDAAAAGEIHVLYGRTRAECRASASPVFPGSRIQTVTQDTAGVPGVAKERDRFGSALAAGDLDHDGYDDLAIGAPGDAGGTGAVTILRGSPTGLTTAGARLVRQGHDGVPGKEEVDDESGSAVRITTAPGRSALTIGAPGESIGKATGAGAVTRIP